jgi:predicted ATP-grasp superfamily ATP-dependent carboligase
LGARGVPVTVGETTRHNPAAYSKYAARAAAYPNPTLHPDRFASWLETTLRDDGIDILFPMDDAEWDVIMREPARFERWCGKAVLPPPESYRIASDKGESVRLALDAGVRCPRTSYPANVSELEAAARALNYPIVVKPRRSSGSRGIRVASDAAELELAYQEVHERYPRPILQEYIPAGDRYDICLLYDEEGRLKASFAQKELRHFPLERGPSTAQESVEAPELIGQAAAIMARLPWRGIVELEFMIHPEEGRPVFMEINPRFWNSLQLAVAAGVDFPWLLYKSASGLNIVDTHTYDIGRRCRSLLPGDTLHFLSSPDRWRMQPSFFAGKRVGGEDDIWSIADPMPAIGALAACARFGLRPEMWRSYFKRT